MDKDVIVLKVPQSVKTRWVSIALKAHTKLVSWVIACVESTLPGDIEAPRVCADFGLPDEPHATITLECDKAIKTRWQTISRADRLRLTDWVVNRVQVAIEAVEKRARGRPPIMQNSKVRRAYLDEARYQKAVQAGDGNFSEGLRRMIDAYIDT